MGVGLRFGSGWELAVVEGCDCAVQSGVVKLAKVRCRWRISQAELTNSHKTEESPATIAFEN